MLPYPQIDPVAIAIGPLQIHWYGLMYLIGIGGAGGWPRCGCSASRRNGRRTNFPTRCSGSPWGDRRRPPGLRAVLRLPPHINQPSLILQVWKGGMSFHGGLIGVLLCSWIFARRNGKSFFELMDFIAPFVPIGLVPGASATSSMPSCGKATDVPWAMVFPTDPQQLARHPSQLYQFALKASRCSSSSGCIRASRGRPWRCPDCSRCATAFSVSSSSSSACLMRSWATLRSAG